MGTFKVAVLAAACVLSGCMSTERGDELQKDLESTNIRLTELEHQLAKTEAAAPTDTDRRLDGINRDTAQLRADVDAMRPPAAARETSSKGAHGNAVTAGHAADASALADVTSLRKAFDARRYQDVVSAAPRLITAKGPGAKDELRYLYAESLFRLKQLPDARTAFNRLLSRHPHSAYSAKALLRLGDIRLALGERTKARSAYADLVRKYPQTAEAGIAKTKLAQLPAAVAH